MNLVLALQADATAAPQANPTAVADAAAAVTSALPGTAQAAPAVLEHGAGASDWLSQASGFAPAVDDEFLLLAWFAIFLAIVIAGTFALLSWRGSRAQDGEAALPRSMISWAALSAFVLVAVFYVQGARLSADMQVAPRGALPIKVGLDEKGFQFTYPNGYVTAELHLPVDRAVRFAFQGASEPYTFAVPAFRLQVAVPLGARREAWVFPSAAGEYDLRSTAVAADPTRVLAATATVHAEGGFEKWYQDISGPPLDLPPLELGQRSYQMRGCTQCHSIDGTKVIGPSFQGFLAREHRMKDGSVVPPTDEYIKESLLDPQAKVVEGFEPVMPSFRGRLHELEIAGLAAYIKSLQ